MIRSADEIKNNGKQIQIFAATLSTIFILLQKLFELLFPYLKNAKFPSNFLFYSSKVTDEQQKVCPTTMFLKG
jgi:hypothetical protein